MHKYSFFFIPNIFLNVFILFHLHFCITFDHSIYPNILGLMGLMSQNANQHLYFCFSFSVEDITDYPDLVETNQISGAGNMLKTLNPILITIIAMSALGVFLGAICGVVLYCACSHGGMSERNLSALENYNFELVDGVKLKKDKLNVQNSYSEAWVRCSWFRMTKRRAELEHKKPHL